MPRRIHPLLPSREAMGRVMFLKRRDLRAGGGFFTFLGGGFGGREGEEFAARRPVSEIRQRAKTSKSATRAAAEPAKGRTPSQIAVTLLTAPERIKTSLIVMPSSLKGAGCKLKSRLFKYP